MKASGNAESTLAKNEWLLMDLASPLHRRPIAEIHPAEILQLLKRIEKSGRRETARRLRGTIGSVCRYAIVTLRASGDPTLALHRALLRPNIQHRAAITDEKEFGQLMVAIDEYDGWPTIRAALQLLALTMTRPGDIRGMRRSEINLEKAVWRIPATRMKMRQPHDVPLSRQALSVLENAWSLSDSELVLPSIRTTDRPLSENALNSALRRIPALVNTGSPNLYYVHADQIDTPVRMTDDSKSVGWDAFFLPFGAVESISGSATNNLRFPGQYFLIEDGLHYNWYRHYDTTIGRFLRADPFGDVQTTQPDIEGILSAIPSSNELRGGSEPVVGIMRTGLRSGFQRRQTANFRDFPDGPSIYAYARSIPTMRIDSTGLLADGLIS
jgi:RHS repeat-associated protein